ncbi:MAG: pyruvate formate lyase family protein [Acutalibacteraceae bacterium]|nr:pyruvate formate lyase family protein [Acutalibacteraceae bacterium]
MKVRTEYKAKFIPSDRLKKVMEYNQELAYTGKRNIYTADTTQLVYHWTDKSNGVVPRTGEWSFPPEMNLSMGDHGCRVDNGQSFPKYDEVPSHVNGYEATAESWAKDYAFLLKNTPASIHPYESVVGEFFWEMNEIRKYNFGEKVHEMGREVRKLGAGGTSHGHTCPDYNIGLTQGWGGIMKRIDASIALYTRLEETEKTSYLTGLKIVCQAIIDYIKDYSEKAYLKAEAETDAKQKALYTQISEDCAYIAENPPKTFHQAVQWIHFAIMTDRIVGHGNGYGRLDLYLNDFYQKDLKDGTITREQAREYLAEMFLKIRGQHFSIGGRLKDGSDASNDMSFIILEAYDMVDDYNNLFLMWHKDINDELMDYACDVLARHGASVPSMANYDLLVDCQLRSGVDPDIAWNVAVSGCQWFCLPGREYCDQDVNALVLLDPMWRTIDRGIEEKVTDFEQLMDIFKDEFKRTSEALRIFKDAQYDVLDKVWPEMATSLNCHGPIERGIDMTGARGVDYQFTSTNILGIPNVADSFYAIKKLVFEEGAYTLAQVRKATDENWKDNEVMRQRFLRQDKFGNDIDEADEMCVRICDIIAEVLDATKNNRGQQYRGSLFQFQGHTCTDVLPATPDGRLAEEPLAHGCNPTAGRNVNGLLATANSVTKIKNYKFQGGSLQIELQPQFFDGKENIGDYIKHFTEVFFSKGAFQINLNIIDLEKLKDAIEHPDNPEYRNIIVKVTGYTTRFICMAKSFQIEFVGRNNYESL